MNAKENKISTCLWFDTQAEEAAKFYTSIFDNSKMGKINRYGKGSKKIPASPAGRHGKPESSVMTAEFQLEGQKFMALNGGPHFKFNEAISLVVNCDTQEEMDRYWQKLSADPAAEQCGWLKDKFGLSWQIVPKVLSELLSTDSEKSERVMKSMLQMKKMDIQALKNA